MTKARPDKKTLERLYVKEDRSIRDIAARLECSKDLIARALKEYGIPARARIRPSRLYEYSLQDLQEKIRNNGVRGTARLVGVSDATLRYHLKRRGKEVLKKSINISFIFLLSFVVILLMMSCSKGGPTSPSLSEEKPDIWCNLNFKLKIKAKPATESDLEEYEGNRFSIRVFSYCKIQDLGEIKIGDPSESVEKEWNNISDFKTGDTKYLFELCYLAHTGLNLISSLSTDNDTYNVNLQITPVTSGVVASPKSLSTTWSFFLGDRKTFEFYLVR